MTITDSDKTTSYPKLLSYRCLADPFVVLALDDYRSVVIMQGDGFTSVGRLLEGRANELWEPFDGAVTIQN